MSARASASASASGYAPPLRAHQWVCLTAVNADPDGPHAAASHHSYRRPRIEHLDLPRALALTPDGRTLYVANTWDGTITPIDVETNTPGPAIRVGSQVSPRYPYALAITSNGRTLYVAYGQDGDDPDGSGVAILQLTP